jgi:hypothetical protein
MLATLDTAVQLLSRGWFLFCKWQDGQGRAAAPPGSALEADLGRRVCACVVLILVCAYHACVTTVDR